MTEETPVVAGQRQVDVGRETPLVRHDHIETLIIESCHQLGVDGLTLCIAHRKGPLLLLSWFQTVAEGAPFQSEMLIRQGTTDGGRMGIALAVLHPGKVEQQPIAVTLLVGDLQVQQLIALVSGASLNQTIISEDTVDHMDVLGRRTYLDRHRTTIAWKVGGRLIEPVFGLCSWCGIIEREEHELTFHRVAFTDTLQRMLTTLQLIVGNGDRGIGLGLLPDSFIDTITHLGIELLTCGISQMEGSRWLIVEQHFFCQFHTERLLTVTQGQ